MPGTNRTTVTLDMVVHKRLKDYRLAVQERLGEDLTYNQIISSLMDAVGAPK